MKKLLLTSVLFLITISPVSSFATNELEVLNKISNDLSGKYQPTAEFFGMAISSLQVKGDTYTHVISYDIPECQIGVFSDGLIITHIQGENKGKQIVVYQDKIIGISYPCEYKEGCVSHQYIWGQTTSRYNEVSACLTSSLELFLEQLE